MPARKNCIRKLFPEGESEGHGATDTELGRDPSGSCAAGCHLEIALAGISCEISKRLWTESVSGTVCALESGTHHQHASASQRRRSHGSGLCRDEGADHQSRNGAKSHPHKFFVAVLPASSYTYAEIQPSQELQHWLSGHVHAFTFLGGTPKIIRPDNLKSGVRKTQLL